MIILLQKMVFLIAELMLAYLLIEGWLSKAVWAKDCENGIFTNIAKMESWATKIHLNHKSNEYWGFMIFYAVLFVLLLFLLF